ncbi:MAG: SUMF1/EgtB/PvdO family nonheme iron enzyme [candidate division Zixibacteria bacterium]|nr:SUMF1/EgtB/PvdO family nonheme iron enzyme [Candidatus Tariuqbacter arcticus]
MRSVRVILPIILLVILVFSCEENPHGPDSDNIFDPDNPSTGGDPFNITAQLTAGGIILDWHPVEIQGLSGYRLYRSEDENSIYDNVIADTDTNTTAYLDTNVVNGHYYYYLVTAYSYLGESRSSGLLPVEISSDPYLAIIGDSAFTMIRIVPLDILASGADSMRIAVDTDISQSTWEEYAVTRTCTLNADAGIKWVQLQVKYPNGDSSNVMEDLILTRELTPQLLLGSGSGFTDTTEIIITFGDAGALSAAIWEYPDSVNADTVSPVPETHSFIITAGDGEKMIYTHLWNDFADSTVVNPIVLDTGAEILSVQHDGEGRVLQYGDILHIELVTVGSDENGTATVDIMDDSGGLREGILLDDMGGGHYASNYVIGYGTDIVDGYIVGRLTDRAGNIAEPDTAQESVNISFEEEGMAFVFAGDFDMGNNSFNPADDELPVHTVCIPDFWISVCEVTNAEFAEFLNDGFSQYWDERMEIKYYPINEFYEAVDSLADRPVRYVSWYAADDYAEWRGMRLPTEAEWEKASRGTDGRSFPWGAAIPFSGLSNFSNSYDPYDGTDYPTTPVGFYDGTNYGGFQTYSDASPYGARDMLGNVSEWCSDYYDDNYYSISPYSNPENTAFSPTRVVRSGSWNTMWMNIYCANRFSFQPNTQSAEIGIRLALDP